MAVNDALGIRMKTYYEQIPKTKLMRRCPVVVRLDGKAFHSFTKGFKRPFDEILIKTMQETMKYLCENIQGCVLGYTQSDEITLVLIDYKKLNSEAWFDYEVQKMCSVAASMATLAFNKAFKRNYNYWKNSVFPTNYLGHLNAPITTDDVVLMQTYNKALEKGAMFDARCFNIPKEEVTNCIYWRQLDATRNSIQMVGQANFSHKELQNKSCNMIQDMLFTEKGINWNDLPTYQKRGSCCIKTVETIVVNLEEDTQTKRYSWVIDDCIPIFKGEDREYIEKLIRVEEE